MKRPLKHYAIALYDALHADGASETAVLQQFVRILAQDGVLNKAPAIIQHFEKHWNAAQHLIDVRVTTARAITETMKKVIAAATTSEDSDTRVSVQSLVDPSLIGGAMIQIGDTVWDGSIRRQLATMKQKLAS